MIVIYIKNIRSIRVILSYAALRTICFAVRVQKKTSESSVLFDVNIKKSVSSV